MLNKVNSLQKLKIKFEGKRQKLLVQIANCQINKDRTNKTIDLRRMLERNMPECPEYMHCETEKKTIRILKNLKCKL